MKDIQNIKEGDYIRVGSYGFSKVVELIKDLTTLKIKAIKDEKDNIIKIEYIQKSNKDFLKLLEIGDYINGNKITHEYFIDGVLYRDSYNNKQYDKLVKIKINEIQDALTHEQYKTNSYKFNH